MLLTYFFISHFSSNSFSFCEFPVPAGGAVSSVRILCHFVGAVKAVYV